MILQTLKLAIIAAVIAIAAPAAAQDCGCGATTQYGSYGGCGVTADNCGRDISQEQAMGLWAGYCSESCGYNGGSSCGGCGQSGCRGGCKLRGKLRSRLGGGAGGCGCNGGGCFTYPTSNAGCGGGVYTDVSIGCGSAGGCKLGGKLRGRHGSRSCGGGCGLGSLRGERGGCGGKLSGLFGGRNSCGGGCGGKLKGLLAKCKLFGGGCGKFNRSRQSCGSNGAYFSEAVGYEYGTAGIQSCVAGTVNSVMAAPTAIMNVAPVMNFAPAINNGCCGSTGVIGTGIAPQGTMQTIQPEIQGNVVEQTHDSHGDAAHGDADHSDAGDAAAEQVQDAVLDATDGN